MQSTDAEISNKAETLVFPKGSNLWKGSSLDFESGISVWPPHSMGKSDVIFGSPSLEWVFAKHRFWELPFKTWQYLDLEIWFRHECESSVQLSALSPLCGDILCSSNFSWLLSNTRERPCLSLPPSFILSSPPKDDIWNQLICCSWHCSVHMDSCLKNDLFCQRIHHYPNLCYMMLD